MCVCVSVCVDGIVSRLIVYGQGDRGWITGQVIHKLKKMVLDASVLNIQYYKVRIKGERRNPGKRSCVPYISTYLKGSLPVALDYGRRTCLTYL